MTDDTINDAVTMRPGSEGTLLANRYRIVRQLGQGGMGSVWFVEDTQLDNKPFAVKMLPSILVANKRAYRQLKDEALLAMRLVHPNIVQIRAFEENDGNPFLVMDYVDGQTLDDYLAEHAPAPLSPGGALGERALPLGKTGTTGVSPVAGGIPEADVLRILRPVAAALDYAHDKGVVHRDVKPGNVMIAKDGTPYILDFGIAREIQETMTRMTGKLSSGTLLYMSPEQLNGALPRPAQDVYSFAALVYECLKGEPPFVRGQIEHQILNNPPPPLDIPTTGPSARGSGTLAASVMAGLAKKPEDRPATCAAVLRESGKSAASPNPQQPTPPPPPQSNAGGSRSRMIVGIPARVFLAIVWAVAFLAIAGGVWWWLCGRTGEAAKATKKEWERRVRRGPGPADYGHTKVQLWKDGPYWADTNIGAEKPWESGCYFWWGDTIGYKRENNAWVASDGSSRNFSFNDVHTPTEGKEIDSLRKEGWVSTHGARSLTPAHDAAHVQWGGRWRMPTDKELADLSQECDWTWTKMEGVDGYVVRGRGEYASASIFLPAAGYGDGTSLYDAGSDSIYWSSVPTLAHANRAWYLDFGLSDHNTSYRSRYNGQPVRPVQGFTK